MHWVCQAASVAGSAHESRGTASNDAFSTAVVGGTAIIAVADGAGSAIQATVGATLAVQTAISHLTAALGDAGRLGATEVNSAVELARTSVIKYAEEFELASADLACTLLLCVANEHEVIAAQIGDGAIVALRVNVQ